MTLYCENCGTLILKDAKFCRVCGSKQNHAPHNAPQPPNALQSPNSHGFSLQINDPVFAKHIKNTNSWSVIFSIILAIAAVAGFYIAGEQSTEMDNPESMYIGFGIGSMFLLIALFQVLGRNRSKTWDGTVEDKKIKKKSKKHTYGDDNVRYENYLEYSVIIRSNQGKQYVITADNDDTLYNYYRIGDRVRNHGRLKSYEKFDKTGDRFIPCSACSKLF
jgi:hypothetical protein